MSRKERDWWRVEGRPNLDLQFLASRWKVEKKRKPFAANARGIRIIALDSSFLSGCGRFKAFFSLSRFSLPSISSFLSILARVPIVARDIAKERKGD